ncbi:MAG: tetratricopeptide repeat protein [Acidobacteria bacterium]|nr:tetratricopeptide repeat protein [Acidobacteriota bacterium]
MIALIAVATAAFLLTRAVAASTRQTNLRDAAAWYTQGEQQLHAGDLDGAIAAFRRASVKNPEEREYVLALARALAAKRLDDEARRALLLLRESAPEDAEINLQLARLAADRQDVTEALRYYHNALYSPWSSDQADMRRRVRLELARFLIAHDQTSRAVSELLVSSVDTPETAAAHVELARLFSQAGDTRHAADQFASALRLEPDNGEALAGAGGTAFRLGDYTLARRYLRRAPADTNITSLREVADLVASADPLASRLAAAERQRRLLAAFRYARQRLDACVVARAQPDADAAALQREAAAFARKLRPPAIRESETIDAGAELAFRISRAAAQRCAPPTSMDRALDLIAKMHGADAR